jgi:hypothetical protein
MTMVLMPPPELDLRVFGWGRELAQHRQIARQIARPILPLGSFARRLLAKPKQAACALAVATDEFCASNQGLANLGQEDGSGSPYAFAHAGPAMADRLPRSAETGGQGNPYPASVYVNSGRGRCSRSPIAAETEAARHLRRRTKFLQYVVAQSVGIALTGLCRFDDLVCEYFIGPDQKPCGHKPVEGSRRHRATQA